MAFSLVFLTSAALFGCALTGFSLPSVTDARAESAQPEIGPAIQQAAPEENVPQAQSVPPKEPAPAPEAIVPPAPSPQKPAQKAAPAAPSPISSSATTDALAAWHARLSAQLKSNKHFPKAARAMGEEGVAYLSFTIDRAGRVISARVSQSSGSAALDKEAIALLRRSSPLPPPPPEVMGDHFRFNLPIRFSLK